MESGNIITSKTEEENDNILDKIQQKKLFTEESIELDEKEKKIKVQEEKIENTSDKENLVLEENKEEEISLKNIQEENLQENLESEISFVEENYKIENKDNLEIQEETLNIENPEENIEKKDETIVKDLVKTREAKNIIIPINDSMLVESGLEIQYTSLQLNNFPISYSNFSNTISFKEVISVGTSMVKIGESILNNVSLKILVYDKFKLLEIKTREFKLALSIDLLNGKTLVKNGDFYKYEIFNRIKNSRFVEVINILKEIFSGVEIEFKFKKLIGNISFENRIEVYKFNLLQELANSYKNIVNTLSLNREKNFTEISNSFYEVFLTEAILEDKKIDSWINFRLINNFDIQTGDNLTFERVHKLDFKGITFDIKEIIKIKSEINEREFTKDNEICSYRKAVEISLEKIEKFN